MAVTMMGAARAGLCFFPNIQKVHAGPDKSAWRGSQFVFVHLVGLRSVSGMGGQPSSVTRFPFLPSWKFCSVAHGRSLLRLLLNPPVNTATSSLPCFSSFSAALCMEDTVSQLRGAEDSTRVHKREASLT